MTAKVDCRVFVTSALYRTKQAILPRQNNQINIGFGENIISVIDPKHPIYKLGVLKRMFA